jgi:hypothetical protein
MAEAKTTNWIYCNSCQHNTRHVLIALKEYRQESPDESAGWWGSIDSGRVQAATHV